MMGADGTAAREESRRAGGRPPTARSVLLRFALGSAVAIAVAFVGGYFALRAVAVDEAKRETRTKVQEAGQLVEACHGDGLLDGQACRVGSGGRRRARARAEQLDRASEDLVGRRPGPLLGRSGADRRALRARPRAAAAPARRRREGGGQRPSATREPARSRAGQADRGVHADPHAVGNAGAVRDLPALRVGHGERAAAADGARTADPRRDRVDPARAGPAPLVADARAAAWERAARGAARERDRGIGAGTPPGRLVPPRRAGAGDRRPRLLARAARRRGRLTRSERTGGCAPQDDRAASQHRARPAHAAGRAASAAPGGGRSRGGDLRPRQPAAGGRRDRVDRDRRRRAARARARGAHLPRHAGSRAERDRVRGCDFAARRADR